jgi:hypothetical protein
MRKTLFVISLFGFVSCSQATLLVYEPFATSGAGSYSTTGTLSGQGPNTLGFNGLSAFSGNWSQNLPSTNGVWIGSLGRTNIPAQGFGIGGRATVVGGGPGASTTPTTISVSRSLSVGPIFQQFSTDMVNINKGTIYMSFMLSADTYRANSWATLGLGNLKIGRFNDAGATSGANTGSLGINLGSDGIPDYQFNLANVSTTSNTHFYVVQLNLNSGGLDSFSAWLDPVTLSPTPSADLTGSGIELSFNSISLESTGVGFNQMSAYYDEIRFGTTWGDVLFIPEPSSLSLLVLGGVAVALRRRQKRA